LQLSACLPNAAIHVRDSGKARHCDAAVASTAHTYRGELAADATAVGQLSKCFDVPCAEANRGQRTEAETLDDYLKKQMQHTNMLISATPENPKWSAGGQMAHAVVGAHSMNNTRSTTPCPNLMEPTKLILSSCIASTPEPQAYVPACISLNCPVPPPPSHPPQFYGNIPCFQEDPFSSAFLDALGVDRTVDIVELLRSAQPDVYED
jgi:hypothetical protein